MAASIFVNLPVKDLMRSMAFFTDLGYKFNLDFTDEKATCMTISDNISVMLLVEGFFKTFTKKEICDTRNYTEGIFALSVDSREEVDEMVAKAIKAGGSAPMPPQDHGWMYQWGYEDLDGHLWELLYIDESKR